MLDTLCPSHQAISATLSGRSLSISTSIAAIDRPGPIPTRRMKEHTSSVAVENLVEGLVSDFSRLSALAARTAVQVVSIERLKRRIQASHVYRLGEVRHKSGSATVGDVVVRAVAGDRDTGKAVQAV